MHVVKKYVLGTNLIIDIMKKLILNENLSIPIKITLF